MRALVKRVLGRRARGSLSRRASRSDLTPLDQAIALTFDASYYRETYVDVVEAGNDPLEHYLEHGRRENRRPSILFDPIWYLEENPDVAASGLDPFEHFLVTGGQEGRDPIPSGFTSAWYLEQHPELRATGNNPLLHFLTEGAGIGHDPTPHFDTSWYLANNPDVAAAGLNPLVHYLRNGIAENRRPNGRGTTMAGGQGGDLDPPGSLASLLNRRRPGLKALRTIPGRGGPRINLVTDSIGPESLFGGVATAILLAALWADQSGRRLRVVTRYSAPDGAGLDALFRTVGVRPGRQPELAYIPMGPGDYLDIGEEDLFLSTSWWSTTAILRTVPAERVVYILQEDERCFYPIGIDSAAAAETMNHPGIRVVVNTAQLLDHLVGTGLDNLRHTAVSFEPSFSAFLRPGRRIGVTKPRNLFFYARPNNPRNLFDLGVAAIDCAVERGVLSEERWRIHFAGKDVPRFNFCDDRPPILHDSLGWADYHELLGRIDLGVSLMASPHPSYPPLDLAASGSVVVTNNWPGKRSFEHVSDRVLMADPTVDELADAIVRGAKLVDSLSGIPFEPAGTPSFQDWPTNLAPVVEHLRGVFGDV